LIHNRRPLRGFSGMTDRSAPWQLLLSSTAHKIYHNQLQSQLTRCKKMVETLDDETLFLLEVLHSHNIPIPPLKTKSPASSDKNQETEEKTCCPSYHAFIEMVTGTDMHGMSRKLIHHKDRFVQNVPVVKCYPHVKNAPCRLVNDVFRSSSKCVQQYSYVFALVEKGEGYNIKTNSTMLIDEESAEFNYVRVPSGCNCEVSIN